MFLLLNRYLIKKMKVGRPDGKLPLVETTLSCSFAASDEAERYPETPDSTSREPWRHDFVRALADKVLKFSHSPFSVLRWIVFILLYCCIVYMRIDVLRDLSKKQPQTTCRPSQFPRMTTHLESTLTSNFASSFFVWRHMWQARI